MQKKWFHLNWNILRHHDFYWLQELCESRGRSGQYPKYMWPVNPCDLTQQSGHRKKNKLNSRMGKSKFLHSICPVLQTWISWKRVFIWDIISCKRVWKTKVFGKRFVQFQTWFTQATTLKYLFQIFLCVRNELAFLLSSFLHEMMFKKILAGNYKGAILNFLSRKLSGETLCKFFQIFPPKVLVYIGHIF